MRVNFVDNESSTLAEIDLKECLPSMALPVEETAPLREEYKCSTFPSPAPRTVENNPNFSGRAGEKSGKKQNEGGINQVASFDQHGRNIITASSAGQCQIFIVEKFLLSDHLPVQCWKVFHAANPNNPNLNSVKVKEIVFGKKWCLLNCTMNRKGDCIRLFDLNDFSFVREFQDTVAKTTLQWCCLSGDEQFIAAAAQEKSNHKIFIWSLLSGIIVKRLETVEAKTIDLAYHPRRPVACACIDVFKQV